MKLKKNFLFLILILTVAVFAVACSAEIEYAKPHVTEISVTDLFFTDGYTVGDSINLDGAKLIVKYSNMESQTIDLTEDMLSGYDMNVPEEEKVVTVSYGGKTTTFTISVSDLQFDSVVLASLPYKNRYVVGETVSPEGATLSVKYKGGKTISVKVTSKMLQTYDNKRVGEQDIYVEYYGYKLSFPVVFEEETVISLSVLHDPNQNSVFIGKSDMLNRDGLRLRLYYDNGLAPAYEAADLTDDLRIYIDDSSVGTVSAKVAYLPENYPTEVLYSFTGASLVSTGDEVYPNKELASNKLIENLTCKTYGKVTSVGANRLTVSTVVEYDVINPKVKVGQIVDISESLGTAGYRNVTASAGGGVILEVGNGKVKMQTVPVTSFNINVKERSYVSMAVTTYPKTKVHKSDITDIIQGDVLDLSTGKVRVEYDNGEWRDISMDDDDLKIVNSDDDLLRNEIRDFSFTSVDDVKDLPAGRYELKYGMNHGYGDKVTCVVTVVDETGRSIYVQDNRYVSLDPALNYTVSISASLNDGGQIKVSECVYHLATVGAGVRQTDLDITAAGRHRLLIIYGGNRENCIDMYVTVVQRYAVDLRIVDKTDNISGRVFRKGDVISLATIQYYIVYNNGDQSEPTGVTPNMLADGSTLTCDELTEENGKTVAFRLPDTEISVELRCTVVPMPILSVSFMQTPIDTVLSSPGSNTNHVDLSGGVLAVYYENGKTAVVGKTGAMLNELLSNVSGTGARIEIKYKDEDTDFLSVEEIASGAHYEAELIYYDADGANSAVTLEYYIISEEDVVQSIKVSLSPEYYKKNYVQCEDWDLTGVTFTVTYKQSMTTGRPMQVTKEMIYDSTTDVVGTNIPVKIKYLGKVDTTTYKINVEPRTETALSVVKTGKNLYYNTDIRPDFSEFKFALGYNAGASVEVSGLDSFDGGLSKAGWWYEIYDEQGFLTHFGRTGHKTVRLYHTTASTVDGETVYSYVSTDIPMEVVENTSAIDRVAYEDLTLGTWNYMNNELPVLEIIASGWELFLNDFDPSTGIVNDKYLTVYYTDGTKGYVKITTDMVTNYDKADGTKGFRPVDITYKTYKTKVCVQVLDAEFTAISVEKTPCVNFIAGSELTRTGGIIRCVYEITESDGTVSYLYKYLNMEDPDVVCTGFNSVIDPALDHVMQDVTLEYRGKTATYMVSVYNKQILHFKYQNTIFFYGNTKAATATPLQYIPEFTLPASDEINLWYVSSEFFIAETDFADYLISHPDEPQGEFIRIECEDGKTYYVNRKYLASHYPVEPLKKEFTRYIVMEVLGNDYYRQANYCMQKYTVIPKVIEVSVVPFTESAYTLDYTDASSDNADIPKAVMYLYQNLDEIVSRQETGGIISSVELLSPNVEYFRIGIFVTNAFDKNNAEHMALLETLFTSVRENVNAYLRGNSILADVSKIRQGINIGYYNGIQPENVSYRIAAGETLTLNGILELLKGSPVLADYGYGIGDFNLSVGTLHHEEEHYTIDFITNKFKVLAREISDYGCTGNWDKATNTLTVSSSEAADYTIAMYISHADGTARAVEEEEFSYYASETCSEGTKIEKPTASGTYYVKAAQDGCFTKDGAPISVVIKLVIE